RMQGGSLDNNRVVIDREVEVEEQGSNLIYIFIALLLLVPLLLILLAFVIRWTRDRDVENEE
ncbi:MAG: hypothetical protein ACMUIE_08550, partial [Thermoplasmatota archaeon]